MSDQYPECDKLNKISEDRDTILEFFEWLNGVKKMTLAEDRTMIDTRDHSDLFAEEPRWVDVEVTRFMPVDRSIESLILEFFDIDPEKMEEERRAMLDSLRGIANA